MDAAGSLLENMLLAREIKTSTEKSNGNRRSDVSKTIIFVDPAFRKIRKTSTQFLKITFSPMGFVQKVAVVRQRRGSISRMPIIALFFQ